MKRYRSALLSIEESQAVMSDEADPEMRQLAREEFEEASSKLPGLEEEIKLLLVPADPDDSKNAIVEIRGGTGGDELRFCRRPFRMYQRYAETKGWQLAVSSVSEGAASGFQGDYFQPDWRRCLWNHEVRKRCASGAACSCHGDTGACAHFCRHGLPFCLEAEDFEVEIHEGKSGGTLSVRAVPVARTSTKVESGVRLRYNWRNPNTGTVEEILIECTETRDQPKNKERALSRLRTSYMTGSIENISMI